MSSLIVEVCEIKEVIHHPNADRLDIATVKGWNCIVGRDQYKVGDWCVFFPPDSVLPSWIIEGHQLEFLKKGGRVGTLKLRGYISQGLILSGDVLPEWAELGDDLAEELGITKYEVPEKIPTGGKITAKRTQNPNFSKYTDIENIQNFPGVFRTDDLVVITEKIHGSNIRFGWLPIEINFHSRDWLGIVRSLFNKYILGRKYEFVYGSHNVQLQWDNAKTFYGKNIYASVLKNYSLIISKLPKNMIFYGEVYGEGVQDLDYGKRGLFLSIFDVKDIQTGKYLDPLKAERLCRDLGLSPVPVLYTGHFDGNALKFGTEGNSAICPSQIREGCVVKSILETNDPKIGRCVLKSINPEYLARKNRTEWH